MQLAFAVVGAALGSAFGPPGALLGLSAAGWGWMVGAVIGQIWVTAHQPTVNTQGPRLSDMKASAGGYGGGIPKTYGSPRVNGNVIWSSDLIETANTQTYGNKKTGKQTVTTYTYSVDCAVGVCEGPILGFRRIWANGKLIYDISGGGPVTDNAIIPLSGMTFYLGTEDQTPNAVMQARLGAANVPAYRGLAYVVFDNLQLEKFGNRHPKFDFEIGTGERLYIGRDYYNDLPIFSRDLITWDRRGNTPENYPAVSRGSDYFCNGFNQFVIFTTFYNASYPGGGWDNFSTTQNGTSWTLGPEVSGWSELWANLGNYWVYAEGKYLAIGTSEGHENWSSTDGLNFVVGHSQEEGGGEDFVHIDWYDVIYSHTADCFISIAYATSSWYLGQIPPAHEFKEMRIYAAPKNDPTNFTKISSFPCGLDIGFSFNLCEFDNQLWTIYQKSATGAEYWVKSSSDGINWEDRYRVPDDDGVNSTFIAYILSDGQKLVLLYGGYYYGTLPNGVLRTQTSTDGDNWSGDNLVQEYDFSYMEKPRYDGRRFIWSNIWNSTEIVRTHFSDDGIHWQYALTGSYTPDGITQIMSISDGDFVQGSETLANVITDICLSAGLEMSDINTGAIADIEVNGYIRTNPMAARSAIEPLLGVYDVDAFESDGQIKFVPKTEGYIGPVIAENDLGANPDSKKGEAVDLVSVARVQELELANEIVVRHIDRSLDYDANQQYARRLTGQSQGSVTIDAPVVLSATEALNLANSLLYRSWIQRDQFTFSTTQKYAAYEPTDLLGIPFGGKYRTVRIVKKEENGYLINWSGVSEDLTTYDQNQSGSSGNQGNTPIIPMYCDTDLLVFETPVLQDAYDYLGFVVVAGGQTAAPWPGGNLYILAEDSVATTISLGALPSRAITGTLTSVLNPVSDPITADFDLVNTFDVSIPWGELESHTEAEVLSGMNTCIVTHYDGSVEVMGFQTATLTSPGNYTISKLLRRIRQNSSFSQNGSYQRFALLTLDAVKPVAMQLPNLNKTYTFAGPAVGTSLDTAATVSCTLTGMSKKPLSPILLAASRQLNNDVLMSWTRRSRIGGSWPTGENGPLGEAYEAYEIDVMASNHTTVLRTLTSTTPSLIYTIANQIADFGSQPDVIEVNIYQMSDFVGRGYPANFTFRLLDADESIQANESTDEGITQEHTLAGNNCNVANTTTTGAVS